MIGRLTGHVVHQGDDGVVTLDAGGVGYEVALPLGSLGRTVREPDGRVTLHVHTVVREDAFLLFGFASLDDRQAFRTLIGIAGVGPKIAIAILGAIPVPELAAVIARRELARLTGISGVGKKTAERLLLELKDKLVPLAPSSPSIAGQVPAHGPPSGKADLLRSALTNLGFRPVEVERGVEGLRADAETADLAVLVREALALLRK